MAHSYTRKAPYPEGHPKRARPRRYYVVERDYIEGMRPSSIESRWSDLFATAKRYARHATSTTGDKSRKAARRAQQIWEAAERTFQSYQNQFGIKPGRRAHLRPVFENPKPRGGRRMARRTAAQRAATRRMIAARRRQLRTKHRTHHKRRHHHTRAKARRRTMPTALIINPRRRRRHHVKRRHHHTRSRRRRAGAIMLINPRRRRRHLSRHRRRINPARGAIGAVKHVLAVGIPATLAGGLVGVADSKLIGGLNPYANVGIKVGAGLLSAVALRRWPTVSAAVAGAIFGGIGYQQGVKLGGGVVVSNAATGMKALAAMAAEDEELMGVLDTELNGMGLTIEAAGGGTNGMGDVDLGGIELGAYEDPTL